ncbi:MAG TPA: OsmC family protein [Verrucomicrobiae bacterium]|jgi:osmotically inducible protein OsmC|nr:OsmC family protein [Verrucomicrobiae bacterium]
MEIQRSAEAVWRGDLKSGQGTTSTETGALREIPYSFKTRFENDRQGTNPEELIAAAHASCFSMAFANMLSGDGHAPKEIKTRALLTMKKVEGGFKLARMHLETTGRVDGLDEAAFQATAEKAKNGCPVSQLLKPGLEEMTLKATLLK